MIRRARPADHGQIAAVNLAAFGQASEGDLVERLRDGGDAVIELVAESDGEIVGHIMFSRLWADDDHLFVALAPLAVRPERQRSGVGGALIGRGLEILRELGVHGVVVLGHPGYYPRFGFSAAAAETIRAPYAGSPAFMALALSPGAFDRPLTVAYPRAFADLDET